MPVDYSKWDALELSDDSDIEVHPNVDKRSFIRAKQNQIHQERAQRKANIETLKYERVVNEGLIKRISGLLNSLKSHATEAKAGSRNPGEVAFQAVMESAASLSPKDDQPPPRPSSVHNAEEPLPTYTKMMATLLDQVNKALDEKKVEQDGRYDAMVSEVEGHIRKVNELQSDLLKKLAELEQEEGRKITSESIHTGFDSSYVSKPSPTPAGSKESSSQMELLNPNYSLDASGKVSENSKTGTVDDDGEDDDDEVNASPLARQFAAIKSTEYRESHSFLSKHPQILTEKETDGLLVLAFEAQLDGKDDYARNCVHQALLIQYCRALGRDGVALFFKRITTPGHQAQGVFFKDVQDTYTKIKTRTREINLERAKDKADGKEEGIEQIQLHAVDPGTEIAINIPPADSDDPEDKAARAIFDAFDPRMKKALESGSLDEVNKVLGKLSVEGAEAVVEKMSEGGILGVTELIDATTEEGQEHLEQLEQEAAAKAAATKVPEPTPDPE